MQAVADHAVVYTFSMRMSISARTDILAYFIKIMIL